MSNQKLTIKQQNSPKLDGKFPHCSQNSDKIGMGLFCWKCRESTKGRIKRHDNCKSLYYHLTHHHSGMDRDCYPKRDDCISMLQVISNALELGVIK